MTNSSIRHFLCILLILGLLLCGCRDTGASDGTGSGDFTRPNGGSVAVYVDEQYRAVFQQIFSPVKLSGEGFSVHWVADEASADIVITDTVLTEEYSNYRVLEPDKLAVRGMESLLLRDSRGVIGIPLFLRLDGFWYDEQLYDNYSLTVPQSLDTWKTCQLQESYPAVYARGDGKTLFWAVVAPVYLYSGGKAEELSGGNFGRSDLQAAMLRLEQIGQTGLLKLSDDARQAFTTTQTCFWMAGVEQLAASYNYKTTLSSWSLTVSPPFQAKEQSYCVVRADVVAVKASADESLTNRFLELLFDQKALEDLSSDTQMPIACQMQYTNGLVPEVPQICYTTLTSSLLKLSYVHCGWSLARQEQIYGIVLDVLEGDLTAIQATDQIINS